MSANQGLVALIAWLTLGYPVLFVASCVIQVIRHGFPEPK